MLEEESGTSSIFHRKEGIYDNWTKKCVLILSLAKGGEEEYKAVLSIRLAGGGKGRSRKPDCFMNVFVKICI